MKKYLFILVITVAALSCSNFRRDHKVDEADSTTADTLPEILSASYMNDIDEYVTYIKANGENLEFLHQTCDRHKNVISILNGDTVRISMIGDSLKEEIEIYYKDSEPLLLSREIILDVDSNYLETAYIKGSKVYKAFRDGEELLNADSIRLFDSLVAIAK